MALLEPRAPDSFAAWGFFNACFERKEHVEPYVAEILARNMLAADPGLAEEFRRALASDPALAGSAEARLDFFLSRHASRDDGLDRYPICRISPVEHRTSERSAVTREARKCSRSG